MGSGPGSLFGLGPLNPLDVQPLHIPTNKKIEVWTQYRVLLSFLGGYNFQEINCRTGKRDEKYTVKRLTVMMVMCSRTFVDECIRNIS